MNITLTYKNFSKQDKKDLGGFTNDYAYSFSHRSLSGRKIWWLVDSIYVGRWKLPARRPTIFVKRTFNGLTYWRKPFERHQVSHSRAMAVGGKWK